MPRRGDGDRDRVSIWEALAASLGIGTAREGVGLTRAQLVRVLAVGALVLVALVVALVAVQDAGESTKREEREERSAGEARTRARIAAEQKPRFRRLAAPLPSAASDADRLRHRRRLLTALEAAIAADARERHRRGTLAAPARRADCVPYVRPRVADPPEPPPGAATGRYECLAVIADVGETERTEAGRAGYPFWARIDLRRGRAVWCKVNPRPAEGAIGNDVFVPLAAECDLKRD